MSHILFSSNIQRLFSVGDKKGPGGWPAWTHRECAILDRVATVLLRLQGVGNKNYAVSSHSQVHWGKIKNFYSTLAFMF